MDTTHSLINLAKRVGARFPNINRGGCCVFASLVADELAKHGVKARGIVGHYGYDNLNVNVREAAKNVRNIGDDEEWEENGINFRHVGLEIEIEGEVYHYDSTGLHEPNGFVGQDTDFCVIPGRLTRNEMRALAGNSWNWNDAFNREDIPALQKLIKKQLGD